MTWEKGRQLKTFDDISYEYNANGIRTAKTVGGVRHEYDLEGSNILRESDALGNVIVPMYDGEEQVCGMTYNGELFFFHKNLQGEIIATAAVAVACVYWPVLSPVLYSLLAKSKTAAVAAMMLLAPIVRYAYA